MKQVLTIAGSDSGGGAGIQADLKTFAALKVYGMSVITAVTAQNTTGVLAIENISPATVEAQLEAIFTDMQVDAVKIGMVSREETIEKIAAALDNYEAARVVLDPVMVSGTGARLLEPEAEQCLLEELLPRALLVTPNIPEAEVILDNRIQSVTEMEQAAREIQKLGCDNVVVKGGHLEKEKSTDILYDGSSCSHLCSEVVATVNTHGTGCTYSSAAAALLARGLDVEQALTGAKEFLTTALKSSFSPGQGEGPVHHFHSYYSF